MYLFFLFLKKNNYNNNNNNYNLNNYNLNNYNHNNYNLNNNSNLTIIKIMFPFKVNRQILVEIYLLITYCKNQLMLINRKRNNYLLKNYKSKNNK